MTDKIFVLTSPPPSAAPPTPVRLAAYFDRLLVELAAMVERYGAPTIVDGYRQAGRLALAQTTHLNAELASMQFGEALALVWAFPNGSPFADAPRQDGRT